MSTKADALTSSVPLNLGDETFELMPTPRAALAISNEFGGFRNVFRRLQEMDYGALQYVAIQGAGVKGNDVDAFSQKLFFAGLNTVTPAILDYAALLMNGGKPLTGAGPKKAETAVGNGA